MALHYNKKLTNIEKLAKCNMDNKIIIRPAGSFYNLLYEKYGTNNFSITAYDPNGYKAKMITKNINLIPLAFLTYKLLSPPNKTK